MTATAIPAPESCKIYTPPDLASAMVAAIATRDRSTTWLEPCVGKGAFLVALNAIGVVPQQITALDLDPIQEDTDQLARTLRPCDFFEFATKSTQRFDRIVANPPYLRTRMYDPELQRRADTLSALAASDAKARNAWLLFLAGSIHLLKEGGAIAFVLPAAWDFADYASGLRTELPTLFEEFQVHRSKRPLFTLVQDGVVVIVGKGYRLSHRRSLRYEHADSDVLIQALKDHSSSVPVAEYKRKAFSENQLGHWCKIRIGAVTGDNDYFLLTEEQRNSARLPEAACVPVLSRARHLQRGSVSRRDWEKLRHSNERIWLFRPSGQILRNKNVRMYLEKLESEGGCRRQNYKVRNRDPWFVTPLPEAVHAFISGTSTFGPWLCLNRFPDLAATNTLYVAEFTQKMTLEMRAAVGLSLLNSQARAHLQPRRYADGLTKWEPGDLEHLVIPRPHAASGALDAYERAIRSLLMKSEENAIAIADAWLASNNQARR